MRSLGLTINNQQSTINQAQKFSRSSQFALNSNEQHSLRHPSQMRPILFELLSPFGFLSFSLLSCGKRVRLWRPSKGNLHLGPKCETGPIWKALFEAVSGNLRQFEKAKEAKVWKLRICAELQNLCKILTEFCFSLKPKERRRKLTGSFLMVCSARTIKHSKHWLLAAA